MKEGDRIYFLIDRFTEISGTVKSFDKDTGAVEVLSDDDGDILFGFEDHTRPNDDDAPNESNP